MGGQLRDRVQAIKDKAHALSERAAFAGQPLLAAQAAELERDVDALLRSLTPFDQTA